MAPRSRQCGLGKLEFLVVVVMFAVLATMLLARLSEIERESERTEVSLTIRNIRVGLRLAVGEHLMRGQEDRLPEVFDTNPVAFLGHQPRGYRTDGIDAPGSWSFDGPSRILIYRPRQPDAFEGKTALRWKMAAQKGPQGRMVGIRLENQPD